MVSTKHVPVSILAIISLVGIAVLMLSVTYYPQTVPFAVQYVGQVPNAPQNTVVVNLDVGEYIAHEAEALTESDLPGLRGGTLHTNGGETDYVQSLRFDEPGGFKGGFVKFARDERGRVSDFLEFDDDVFKYQIEFGSGLRSPVVAGHLPDIEDEDLEMLGDTYSLVGTSVDTATKRISLRFFGGFGSIEFEDTNYADDNYQEFGAKVNGKQIDAKVKIKATDSGGQLSVYSIQYLLTANAIQGTLQVPPPHCAREFLQYPTGLLSPKFDICYKGFEGEPAQPQEISGNEMRVSASGDDEYRIIAHNTRGELYQIPLAQLPGMYGNKGRNLVFIEAPAPGAPNIQINDYFLVNSKDDIYGDSHVLQYQRFENGIAYFTDLAEGTKSATVDLTTMQGRLLVGEGTYLFQVGAGDALAMDQNNDAMINGAEAVFILQGGHTLDLGPGFVVKVITPSRLFDDGGGDETTKFNILFGSEINLDVPSPQGTVFKLASTDGHKQGLTKFGIFWDWDTNPNSGTLQLVIPGSGRVVRSGSFGQVYISLEREKLMKPMQVPLPPAKCGDAIITPPEFCDPPGSLCAGKVAFQRGTCSNDCSSCVPANPAKCGNNVLDPGEQCEKAADCKAGQACAGCKCVAAPPNVCGNGVVEPGEQCEKSADCAPGLACSSGCKCVQPNCAVPGRCRVWAGCSATSDLLVIDGIPSGCVDAYQSAAQGVDYCGAFPIARLSQDCNYMDQSTKANCVCPRRPQLEMPAPVGQLNWWQRLVLWWHNLWSAQPKIEVAAGVQGVNCKDSSPCRFWDSRCGQGHEPLYVDGVFKECVDAYQAASSGISYCGHKPLGLESAYCNYMSSDPREKLPCVCK